MITEQDVKIKTKKDGIYLSAKTERGDYGQFYNTVHPDRPHFIPNRKSAVDRFLQFYNQFE